MAAEIGAPAPSFTLRDQQKNEVSLSDFQGSKTLVVFIPFPFTGTCEGELCEIRDNLSELESADAEVVVITCDTVHANRMWSEQQHFGFKILSDFWPHGEVTKSYGCFNEATGSANRATYVLDEEGVVREIIATDSLGTPREFTAYTAALGEI